jgi:hypothetical protein
MKTNEIIKKLAAAAVVRYIKGDTEPMKKLSIKLFNAGMDWFDVQNVFIMTTKWEDREEFIYKIYEEWQVE